MADRVTIQDIADALGLSRNTVSKAINNTGSLADTTREKILNKAAEMGYKQFSYLAFPKLSMSQPEMPDESGEISLFTRKSLGNSHFASPMLDNFQQEITKLGYSLTMHLVLGSDVQNMQLPQSFNKKKTTGIICFEMFEPSYSRMLCSLGIPILFVDAPAVLIDAPLEADILYMDNRTGILSFIQQMKQKGKTKFGFVGDYMHCHSFYERYSAFREALELLDLPFQKEYCMTGRVPVTDGNPDEGPLYRSYLLQNIKEMEKLPDVFLCANDFVAIDLLQEFKKIGISVPQDVYVCGFDDSPESRVITPSLTTIHIHSQIMGISAADLLISRIREPSLNFRTVHTETTLICRESTEDSTT